jgi:hypothetical protein
MVTAPVLAVDIIPPGIPVAPGGTDFARVEALFPISQSVLRKVTPEILKTYTQEQMDQLYARLSSGPIPDGAYYGSVSFASDNGIKDTSLKRLAQFFGDFGFKMDVNKVAAFAERIWRGKHFYKSQKILRNLMDDNGVLGLFVKGLQAVPQGKELMDVLPEHARAIVRSLRTTTDVDGKKYHELFPAKVFCGQSLLDSRRESVVIDYLFTDEVEGYNVIPDALAGREGMKIRDEIRMIRPGFYLGRAYMDKVFVLNFMLFNQKASEQTEASDDCWSGTQARGIVKN